MAPHSNPRARAESTGEATTGAAGPPARHHPPPVLLLSICGFSRRCHARLVLHNGPGPQLSGQEGSHHVGAQQQSRFPQVLRLPLQIGPRKDPISHSQILGVKTSASFSGDMIQPMHHGLNWNWPRNWNCPSELCPGHCAVLGDTALTAGGGLSGHRAVWDPLRQHGKDSRAHLGETREPSVTAESRGSLHLQARSGALPTG